MVQVHSHLLVGTEGEIEKFDEPILAVVGVAEGVQEYGALEGGELEAGLLAAPVHPLEHSPPALDPAGGEVEVESPGRYLLHLLSSNESVDAVLAPHEDGVVRGEDLTDPGMALAVGDDDPLMLFAPLKLCLQRLLKVVEVDVKPRLQVADLEGEVELLRYLLDLILEYAAGDDRVHGQP